MRKLQVYLSLVVILFSIVSIASPVFSQPNHRPATFLGFDATLVWGVAEYGAAGYIKEITGINLGIGFTKRYYSGLGMRPGLFNFYWGFGTFVVLLPYIEWGFTYALPLGGGEQLLNIDIGFLYLVFPHIGITLAF